jgi:hypothetical protein
MVGEKTAVRPERNRAGAAYWNRAQDQACLI